MRIAIHTLGCKVNQVETAALEAELCRRGHVLVPFEEAADAYIVNTCTVTAVSDKKSRQMVRQAQKRAPGAVVAVCGCYAQTAPEAVEALGVDLDSGVSTATLPGDGQAKYNGYSYCYELDQEACLELFNQLLNPYTTEITLDMTNMFQVP